MFDERKATHAAAYLLSKAGVEGLEPTKLMKLMYLADRAAWKKAGDSISSDTYASVESGPVLWKTDDLMEGNAEDGAGEHWSKVIRSWRGKDATFLGLQPGVLLEHLDELSEFDCKTMNAVWDEYGGESAAELVAITHGFDEWEDPGDAGCEEIPLASILKAVGHSPELVRDLVADVKARDEQDAFLASIEE